VVGRLVEKEEVGLEKKRTRQRDAFALSNGKIADQRIARAAASRSQPPVTSS